MNYLFMEDILSHVCISDSYVSIIGKCEKYSFFLVFRDRVSQYSLIIMDIVKKLI